MMLEAIIFSKNRPLQLDGLIETAKKFASSLRLHVLYTYDSEVFYTGYERAKEKHMDVFFHKETVFKHDVMLLLEKIESGYMCFFSDDDLFFAPFTIPSELPSDVLCFSPRLGLNTTYCLNFDKQQRFVGEEKGDYLLWDWKTGEWDFGYPMSIDGHVFRTDDLREIMKKIDFDDPFELENNLTKYIHASSLGSLRPKMMSARQSVLVGVPDNKVMFNFPFPHAGGSVAALNKRFVEGEHMRPFEMDFTHVKGAHQIIPLVIS